MLKPMFDHEARLRKMKSKDIQQRMWRCDATGCFCCWALDVGFVGVMGVEVLFVVTSIYSSIYELLSLFIAWGCMVYDMLRHFCCDFEEACASF
jgi:hypothetical protein